MTALAAVFAAQLAAPLPMFLVGYVVNQSSNVMAYSSQSKVKTAGELELASRSSRVRSFDQSWIVQASPYLHHLSPLPTHTAMLLAEFSQCIDPSGFQHALIAACSRCRIQHIDLYRLGPSTRETLAFLDLPSVFKGVCQSFERLAANHNTACRMLHADGMATDDARGHAPPLLLGPAA